MNFPDGLLEVGEALSTISKDFADPTYEAARHVLLTTRKYDPAPSSIDNPSIDILANISNIWVELSRTQSDPHNYFNPEINSTILKNFLRKIAIPIVGYEYYQVGYGFITDDVVKEGFKSISSQSFFEAIFGRDVKMQTSSTFLDNEFIDFAVAKRRDQLAITDMKIL
jgi:hypothetical protein